MKYTETPNTTSPIVHADDFGVTLEQSQRILACTLGADTGVGNSAGANSGALNSLSILVTSPAWRECATLLPAEGLLVGLHINLVEGMSCAGHDQAPLITAEDGTLNRGFGSLLLLNITHGSELRRNVAREVGAQIAQFLEVFPQHKDHLRLDGHQHVHMIPAVFDGVLDAIQEHNCTVEYVRIPAEPLAPFVRSGAWMQVKPINFIKHVVLNVLWKMNKRKEPELARRAAVFCGLNFSGCMTLEHVQKVLPAFVDYAAERHQPLELLFHPGGAEEDAYPEHYNTSKDFFASPLRAEEAAALQNLSV